MNLRRAELLDWARLYAWRNDPVTLAIGSNGKPVALSDHMAWLVARLAAPSDTCQVFIATGDPTYNTIGMGRLDYRDAGVELSFAIDSRVRGRNYAAALIAALITQIVPDPHTERVVYAVVNVDNHASLRAFASAGFYPLPNDQGRMPSPVTLVKGAQDVYLDGVAGAGIASRRVGHPAAAAAPRAKPARSKNRRTDPATTDAVPWVPAGTAGSGGGTSAEGGERPAGSGADPKPSR